MFKYLFIISICFNIFYSQSFFSKFISKNQEFLESPIQYISFDYTTKNIDVFSEQEHGKIIISKNRYKIILKNYIFLVQRTNMKRYNKTTNQIFIEDNNPKLDSLILNFFNINHLDLVQLESNGKITSIPSILNIEDLILDLDFSSDSSSIKNINIYYNKISLSIFNLDFSNKNLYSDDPFSFEFPDAFIFDLRD